MKVLRLLAVRLLLALPILFALLLFTFMLVRLSGNEPVGLLVGPTASAEEIAAVTAKLKLDQPIWRQFLEFVVLVAQGDLGRSWLSDAPVLDELLLRLPATLEMVLIGAALGALMGVPAGLAAAMRPNSIFDHVSRVLALIGFGMPTIFLGLVLVFVFFFVLQWAPPPMGRIDLIISQPPTVTGSYLIDAVIAGDAEAAWSAAGRLVLPCLSVAIVYAAPLLNQTRAIALDVLSSDFAHYADVAGLPRRELRRILWRNSAVPVVTYGATELIALFGAASVLELIFAWGGMSQFGLMAMLKGDFAVVQGYVLFMSVIAVIVFFLADLLVLWLEPRARLEAA